MTNSSIKVLVVDDHPMIRHGLIGMLRAADGMECVGEAENGYEAIRMCNQLSPDIVLMDMVMPDMDGAAATKTVCELSPKTQVIVLTSFVDQTLVYRAMQSGAHGYLLKTARADELVNAIRSVYSGKRMLAPEAADALSRAAETSAGAPKLTDRELEILTLMAHGLSNAAIGSRLFITLPTVKFHITHILSKLNASNRTEAVLNAIKLHLVPDQH